MNYWKRLPLAAVGILASITMLSAPEQTANPLLISANLILPNYDRPTLAEANISSANIDLQKTNRQKTDFQKLNAAQQIEVINRTLKAVKAVERQAVSQTEALTSQPWDAATSDQTWSSIEELWVKNANELARFLPEKPNAGKEQSAAVGALVTTQLFPLYREYVNRQELTAAMHAYHKSIFLAEQPQAGSYAQCDTEAGFADSPKQWSEIVTLRKKSVEYLEGVSANASFYDEQVLPVKADYQEKLQLASRFYRYSHWHFAIQKAVCATEWGEQATDSGKPADWAQSAALWKQGIELLENAPERIPFEVPTPVRDNYQTAENNLELWKTNLADAELRASAQQ